MKITVSPFTDGHILDLKITVKSEKHEASVRICKEHTNIVEIIKDGQILFEKEHEENSAECPEADYSLLNIADIFDFANSVEINDIHEMHLIIPRHAFFLPAERGSGKTYRGITSRIGELIKDMPAAVFIDLLQTGDHLEQKGQVIRTAGHSVKQIRL